MNQTNEAAPKWRKKSIRSGVCSWAMVSRKATRKTIITITRKTKIMIPGMVWYSSTSCITSTSYCKKIFFNLNWQLSDHEKYNYMHQLKPNWNGISLTFFQMYKRQWAIVYRDQSENSSILQVNSCLVTAHPIESKINSSMNRDWNDKECSIFQVI